MKKSAGLINDVKERSDQKKSEILRKEEVKQIEQAQQHLVRLRQRTEKLLAAYRNETTHVMATSKEFIAPSDNGDVGELSASIEEVLQEIHKFKTEIDDEEEIRRVLFRRIRRLIFAAVVVLAAFGAVGFLIVSNSRSSTDSSNVNDGSIGDLSFTDLLSQDQERLAQALNCTRIKPFAVGAPATSGFTCSSDSRSEFTLSVFLYAPGQEDHQNRTRRACEKAKELMRQTVYVLRKEGIFVYSTALEAVETSVVAPLFTAFDSASCTEISSNEVTP